MADIDLDEEEKQFDAWLEKSEGGLSVINGLDQLFQTLTQVPLRKHCRDALRLAWRAGRIREMEREIERLGGEG